MTNPNPNKPLCPGWKGIPDGFAAAAPLQKLAYLLATTFGTGHLPASGTWGALVAWAVHSFLFPDAFTLKNWPSALAILIAVILIGIWSAEVVERFTGVKDDSRINIDEIAGYCLAVLFLPPGLKYTIPGFVLCRVFDIIKPPPANRLQDLHGGVGIMIDDLIASLYACAAMHLIVWLFMGGY